MPRTIIVGDVHGCSVELEALLERVKFDLGDLLVSVGDVVAKGPDSRGALDILRRTGAILVRGNHEARLLAWKNAPNEVVLGKNHQEVASKLREQDWTLLQASPFWFDLPAHEARVVHAGVVPNVSIEKQTAENLVTIRSIDSKGEASDRASGNVLWGEVYKGPPHVVFGHNALTGLQLHPWATGLDTGCVYGGRLAALVLSEGQKIPKRAAERQPLLVFEPARRVYVDAKG
ncbi:MAG: metallophosphoesterase family protein [Polyangiaceae bacterium]